MLERLPALFRSAIYALRGGFLIRPLAIALSLGTAGAVLSWLEERVPEVSAWVPIVLFPSREDPGVAQIILSSIVRDHTTQWTLGAFLGTFSYCMAALCPPRAPYPTVLCPSQH